MAIDGDSQTQLVEEPATVVGGIALLVGLIAVVLAIVPPVHLFDLFVIALAAGAAVATLCLKGRQAQPGRGLGIAALVLVGLAAVIWPVRLAVTAARHRAAAQDFKAEMIRTVQIGIAGIEADELAESARQRGVPEEKIRSARHRLDTDLQRLREQDLSDAQTEQRTEAALQTFRQELVADE